MKYYLFVCFIVLFTSCNKSTEVSLFNNYSYQIQADETVQQVGGKVSKEYDQMFHFENIQVPLYKIFKGKKYTRFIGLPYQSSLNQICSEIEHRKYTLLSSEKTDSTAHYLQTQNHKFISEFIYHPDSSITLYVATVYDDSTSLASTQSLIKCITKSE